MREHTAGWHARAERTGIVHAILGGTADRPGYALFLRNLLPVYRALEGELERNRGLPGLDPIARPEVYRSVALESDLLNIVGPDWHLRLPLLPESRSLSSRIAGLAESGDGARLIAHAYTRFLGDLNGGQILQRLLMRSLRLKPAELAFYRFPAIADLGVFKREYREAFDRADRAIASSEQVIEESALAFEFNIALSQAVQDAVIRQRSGTV
jgi:heme oxygenase